MLEERIKAHINGPFPKGVFVGDCCYILPDEIYQGIWEKKYNFADGEIRADDGRLIMVVANTYDGDGGYDGTVKNYKTGKADYITFAVDAGVIAVVNMEFAKPDWKDDSTVTDNCYVHDEPVDNFYFLADTDGEFSIDINYDCGGSDCHVGISTAPECDDCEEDDFSFFMDDEDEY